MTVSADRSMIRCDRKRDDIAYKAVWHDENLFDARTSSEIGVLRWMRNQ